MSIFNKRNALVGFLAMRALEHGRSRRDLRAMKLATFVALALISAGLLAGVVAVLARRRRRVAEIDEEAASIEEAADEIIGEFVAAATEQVPTT